MNIIYIFVTSFDDPVSPEESEAEVEEAAPPIRANRLRVKKKNKRNA